MGEIEIHRDYILDLYMNKFWSANRIAEDLGVSRQGVILALQSWGLDTSKAVGSWVEVVCSWEPCSRKYKINRSVARGKKERNEPNFCSRVCYGKYLNKQLS